MVLAGSSATSAHSISMASRNSGGSARGMSGSGSTLFAVYRNERDRDDAAMQLGSKFGRAVPTTSA